MKGALIFNAGLGVSFSLRELHRIKWLRHLPDKYFVWAQTASGLLFTTFGIVAIGETLKAAEVQQKLILWGTVTSIEEAMSLLTELIKEFTTQLSFCSNRGSLYSNHALAMEKGICRD